MELQCAVVVKGSISETRHERKGTISLILDVALCVKMRMFLLYRVKENTLLKLIPLFVCLLFSIWLLEHLELGVVCIVFLPKIILDT